MGRVRQLLGYDTIWTYIGGENVAERDWNAIRAEYASGDMGLAELSKKHSIPLRTIKERCAREGWVEERKHHRADVVQKVSQKAADLEAERLEQLQNSVANVSELLGEDLIRLMAQHRTGEVIGENDVRVIKDMVAALKTVSEVMKSLYMIPVEKEEETKIGGVIFLPPIMERSETNEM